ncbi:MAG: DUF4013 domain-containing protein [Chloroflexota bacterium]
MDIGKAISYVFNDERWVTKVLLGGLIIAIPILNFAVTGYVLKTARNVAYGNPQPLPEWGEDFGDTFMRGVHGFVISLVYAIPLIIVALLLVCIVAIAFGGSEETTAAFELILNCIVSPLISIGGYITLLFVYAAYARYITSNYTLSEALKIGEVISTVRSKPSPWLILLLVYFVSSLVVPFGLIACLIGVFFVAFIAQCVPAHILGQIIAQQGAVSTYTPDMPGYDPS